MLHFNKLILMLKINICISKSYNCENKYKELCNIKFSNELSKYY